MNYLVRQIKELELCAATAVTVRAAGKPDGHKDLLTLALVGLVLLAAAARPFPHAMKQLLKAALNTILGLRPCWC